MSLELPDFVVKGMARNRAQLLRALDAVTATSVCATIKLGTSRLSRFRNEKDEDDRTVFDIFCAMLTACGLKVVPSTFVVVDPEELQAYRRLAAAKCREDAPESQFGEMQ